LTAKYDPYFDLLHFHNVKFLIIQK
jgi:hypothetical protein